MNLTLKPFTALITRNSHVQVMLSLELCGWKLVVVKLVWGFTWSLDENSYLFLHVHTHTSLLFYFYSGFILLFVVRKLFKTIMVIYGSFCFFRCQEWHNELFHQFSLFSVNQASFRSLCCQLAVARVSGHMNGKNCIRTKQTQDLLKARKTRHD